MINLLQFDTINEYGLAWNISARTLLMLCNKIDNCLLIYKYKLPTGKNVPIIVNKFGVTHQDKIIYEKLKGDSIILFHLDVFMQEPKKIRYLLDWCLQNDIGLYIPTVDFDSKWLYFNRKIEHLLEITQIISEYELKKWDLKEIKYNTDSEIDGVIFEKLKPLLRDISIRKIIR